MEIRYDADFTGILRARGGSSPDGVRMLSDAVYSPRTRR